MTVKGEVVPVLKAIARRRGRNLYFIFVQILPPEASHRCNRRDRCSVQSDLAINSFMISLVPPYIRCTRASVHISAIAYSCI